MTDMTCNAPRLVLLATGAAGEPSGAWFEPIHQADLARAAARGGLHLVTVGAGWLRTLDPAVAMGQLLGPGRPAPLPPLRRATYDALSALPGMVVQAPARSDGCLPSNGPRGPATKLQTSKRTLRVGSIVLASTVVEEGWFEAVIVAIQPGSELQLRWRDYPNLDPFTRPLAAVAVPPAGGVR